MKKKAEGRGYQNTRVMKAERGTGNKKETSRKAS